MEIIRKDLINEAIILFFGQKMRVACDRKCEKAWGLNNRPSTLQDDRFLMDNELGDAPIDPGTYECGIGKPASPNEFPQKWCVRECERCASSRPGEWEKPLKLKKF